MDPNKQSFLGGSQTHAANSIKLQSGAEVESMSPEDFKRLKRMRLFAGLSTPELETVAARGTVRYMRKNTIFIERGEASTALYLILCGKVKVYTVNAQHNEQVLSILGPGEHLGELALLTDAVRTASATTLEDSQLMVLSRREFVECLSECPQIALNLDDSLAERALSPNIGEKVAAQYRAWSRFRRSGLPMIVLIGGCTGTGKSTVAAELALRLDIGRIQSTDILRDVVRLFVPEHQAPELHFSSYEAWRVSNGGMNEHDHDTRLIAGFRAQSNTLSATVDAVINRSVKERASIIIEGIHVHPDYYHRLIQEEAVVVSFLLINPSTEKLKKHFLRRGELAPSRGATRYMENFSAIWQIQGYLVDEAERCGVPSIPNTDVDETLRTVIDIITERLEERFL